MISYEETNEFIRDFKKLLKKFSSLNDDFGISKKYTIELFHVKSIDNRGIFEIQGIGNTIERQFFKIKKFQCKSLKGRGARSGIRVTYVYFPTEQRILFLEIYFKANQENENRQRIIDFINATK
jgi:hypothetical protein